MVSATVHLVSDVGYNTKPVNSTLTPSVQAIVAYGCVQFVCESAGSETFAQDSQPADVSRVEQVELQRYMRFASAAYGALGKV
jgi:hypothetical protein